MLLSMLHIFSFIKINRELFQMFVSCTRDDSLHTESHDYTHHYNILSKRTENLSLTVELTDLGPKLALEVHF